MDMQLVGFLLVVYIVVTSADHERRQREKTICRKLNVNAKPLLRSRMTCRDGFGLKISEGVQCCVPCEEKCTREGYARYTPMTSINNATYNFGPYPDMYMKNDGCFGQCIKCSDIKSFHYYWDSTKNLCLQCRHCESLDMVVIKNCTDTENTECRSSVPKPNPVIREFSLHTGSVVAETSTVVDEVSTQDSQRLWLLFILPLVIIIIVLIIGLVYKCHMKNHGRNKRARREVRVDVEQDPAAVELQPLRTENNYVDEPREAQVHDYESLNDKAGDNMKLDHRMNNGIRDEVTPLTATPYGNRSDSGVNDAETPQLNSLELNNVSRAESINEGPVLEQESDQEHVHDDLVNRTADPNRIQQETAVQESSELVANQPESQKTVLVYISESKSKPPVDENTRDMNTTHDIEAIQLEDSQSDSLVGDNLRQKNISHSSKTPPIDSTQGESTMSDNSRNMKSTLVGKTEQPVDSTSVGSNARNMNIPQVKETKRQVNVTRKLSDENKSGRKRHLSQELPKVHRRLQRSLSVPAGYRYNVIRKISESWFRYKKKRCSLKGK